MFSTIIFGSKLSRMVNVYYDIVFGSKISRIVNA
jgi:hypothetical protein